MKNSIRTLLMTLLLSTICGSQMVYSAELMRDTKAIIKFVPSTEPVNPVDPEKPEIQVNPVDPIDPEKPVEPGTSGPLSLDYASNFSFGEQKLTTLDEVYYAALQEVIDPLESATPYKTANYTQVSDLRGTIKGWTLSVKQNGQFKTAEGKELSGAQLQLNNGMTSTNSSSPAPSAMSEIKLTPDGDGVVSNILIAKEGQGGGTHTLHFGVISEDKPEESTAAKGVQLSVPGKTEKLAESYSTTLVWILSDTPVG